jgi:two-component system, chemotaxis family, protein-glutamate methylesterase/glutaminase
MKRRVPKGFTHPVDAVALGASAGGIDALFSVLGGLPHTPATPLVAVLHLPPTHDSRLAEVFSARLALTAREAQAHAPVEPGLLYFAPPGYHLQVEPDRTFSLSCDDPVLFSRPSIDVLFESCADAYGPRLAGIVLTGANEDGAEGLACIKAAGGLTVVQDPDEAAHKAMPQAAIRRAQPHFVLPLAAIAGLLHTLVLP